MTHDNTGGDDDAPARPGPIGAAWMLGQAAAASENVTAQMHVAHSIKAGVFPEQTDICDVIASAIRAIPLPSNADLLVEAMKLPEVAAAFVACKIIRDVVMEGHDNLGEMVMHFLEAAEPASAALAPFTAAKETA